MNFERLREQLAGIVGTDHIVAAESCAPYVVDDQIPGAVVFPANVQELAEIMMLASSERLSVIPRGSGTKIGLGRVPERVDLVVGLTQLKQIIDHEPGDLTATFQAGILLCEVQTSLHGSGQFLPFDPAHSEHATIGGILATNTSGPWRHRYGTARDLVIGIRVVHADGTITKGGAKVVKNVSGYDMNKLYVGSLGTLGIICEATFKLSPLPAVEQTWVALFSTGEATACVIAQILHSTIVCSRLEFLSSRAAQSVGRQIDCTVADGIVAVAISVGSMPEVVDAQITAIGTLCRREGAIAGFLVEGSAHDNLWRAISDFSSASRDGHYRVMLKASVPLTKILETVHRAEALGCDLGMESATVAEAGCGIVRLCWTGETDALERDATFIAKAVEDLRSWVMHNGGSMVILLAPPAIKMLVDVWGPVGSALSLMQNLKQQFDPQRLLNPGRFVGGI